MHTVSKKKIVSFIIFIDNKSNLIISNSTNNGLYTFRQIIVAHLVKKFGYNSEGMRFLIGVIGMMKVATKLHK